jgi:hypothetical protein
MKRKRIKKKHTFGLEYLTSSRREREREGEYLVTSPSLLRLLFLPTMFPYGV